jgi:energy-coupling factor transport system ATP-binding protein
LAKELDWDPLPLTIKEGQRFARRLQLPSSAPLANRTEPVGAKPQPVVNVRDLWFSYGQREALCGINLAVGQGEFMALMGRNGSGKTTLLKHIVGLLHPDRGRVELWSEDTRRLKTEAIVQRVGYLPQNPNALLFADTLRDELDFTRRSQGLPMEGYDELLQALSLEQHINAYPRDLSVGERQRAALAAILVAGPEVILLDEPTRGLDYTQKQALADFLAEQCRQGKTVIMSTHDVELVARCADRVVILGEGQVVVDGPVRAVMTESLVFSSQINKLFRDSRFLTVEDALEGIRG